MSPARKLLSWAVLTSAVVVVIAFAVANRHPVEVSLEPLPVILAAPLYVVVMSAMLIGLLIGGWAAWQRGGKWRRRARQQGREATRLSTALEEARKSPPTTAVVPAGGRVERG